VLDLDALAAAEGENWVWAGAACLGPDYRHAMIALSRGGADACVQREFDCEALAFVEGGFALAEAKSEVTWIDADTLYVATDFGPGSLTESGYPRLVKRWRRGTPLSAAATVFEARTEHIWAEVRVDATPGFERTILERATDFFHRETFLLGAGDALVPLDIPTDSTPTFWRDTLLLEIRSDWQPGTTRFAAGSLLATDAAAWLCGERELQAIFAPTPGRALAGIALTREHLLLTLLDDVTGRIERWRRDGSAFSGGAVEAPRGAAWP
jgi:prolyl oligopeptidase